VGVKLQAMKPTKAIQDSGPGLKLESLDRLFDAFCTTKPGGMGMGVSICQSIIKAHGTHVPHGAVFQFTLPQSRKSIE